MIQNVRTYFLLVFRETVCYSGVVSAHSMNQGMQQQMVASAAMQQTMRILQANRSELHQIVSQALQSNPTLDELVAPHEQLLREEASHDSEYSFQPTVEQVCDSPSLSSHLRDQIMQEDFSPELTRECLRLIDHLDTRGYLSVEDIGDGQLVQKALAKIQQLEPAGVGARDLRECLLIQLQQRDEESSLAATLLRDHWEDLVQHRYASAATSLGVAEEDVRGAAERLTRLQAHPAIDFTRTESNVILPDILVEEGEQGDLLVSLTGEDIPQLAISADYRSMMAEKAENKELREYLSRCFREARDMISAIQQRQHTILQVARAIVTRQAAFFHRGVQDLLPLKMEQIAEDTELHLSTISRAVRGKYVKCSFGVYELRYFFQRDVGRDQDDSVTPTQIKQRLARYIAEEDKSSPLSDSALMSLLADEGIYIARRTVAKYRDQLGLLPAQQRK